MEFEKTNRMQLVQSDEAAFVGQLKAQEGKAIWLCGGGELAGKLLDAQLTDELIVTLNPVVFGEGIRLFGASKRRSI